MDISIVIVNWNASQIITKCLSGLRNAITEAEMQVIVIDNASSDGSVDMIKAAFPEVQLIESNTNVGFAKACNIGARRCVAPLIMYLNPDVILPKGTISAICNFMNRDERIGAIGTKIVDTEGNVQELGIQRFPSPISEFIRMLVYSQPYARYLGILFPRKDPSTSGIVKKLYGACLTVRRSIVEDIKGFDERFFMYLEDVDLCRRISERGWQLYYLSETLVVHDQGSCTHNAHAGFSTLMLCDSGASYMNKYYSWPGEYLFRCGCMLTALVKLLVCSCMYILTYACGSVSKYRWRNRLSKHLRIILWATFIIRPRIP